MELAVLPGNCELHYWYVALDLPAYANGLLAW